MPNLIRTDGDFRIALGQWFENSEQCIVLYGHISDWLTRNVTNMSHAFEDMVDFNEDISRWNVSNVTDMSSMFWGATSFNQPIGAWDTHNVTSMWNMFYEAGSFN